MQQEEQEYQEAFPPPPPFYKNYGKDNAALVDANKLLPPKPVQGLYRLYGAHTSVQKKIYKNNQHITSWKPK